MALTDGDNAADRAPPLDGRRQRTVDSRARIIAAMMALAQEGRITLSAELVAERANVGLRTVFRHFKDMDSLYREMSLAIEGRLRDEISLAFVAGDWRGRVRELVGRRVAVFEKIAPFKRAEAAHRHRSRWLDQDAARLTALLREIMRGVLPPTVADDPVLFEAFDMTLSFEAWNRLRREQALDAAAARRVVEHVVEALLAAVKDA
jgi:AcrR family transcriptional regulator